MSFLYRLLQKTKSWTDALLYISLLSVISYFITTLTKHKVSDRLRYWIIKRSDLKFVMSTGFCLSQAGEIFQPNHKCSASLEVGDVLLNREIRVFGGVKWIVHTSLMTKVILFLRPHYAPVYCKVKENMHRNTVPPKCLCGVIPLLFFSLWIQIFTVSSWNLNQKFIMFKMDVNITVYWSVNCDDAVGYEWSSTAKI